MSPRGERTAVKLRLILLGALVYTVVTFAVSILFLKPAKPLIGIRGEKLITIKSFGNEIIDINITNTVLTAWIIMALLLIFWFFATRKKEDVPTGLQNFGEAIIEAIENFVNGIAGEQNGRRFFPLIATLFIYIAFANWLSLTPLFNTIGIFEPVHTEAHEKMQPRAVTFKGDSISYIAPGASDFQFDTTSCNDKEDAALEQCREKVFEDTTAGKVKSNEKVGTLAPYLRGINTDLMTPASFAIVAVLMVEYWGISTVGFFRYASRFVNFSSPINFFVGFLESIAELARLISFSFRLFGNMLAGEILLLVMTFLMPLVSTFLLVFYGLELFVGAIQAFVFGALTLVFAGLAVAHHGGEDHAEEAGH
jgi:F-type H+-transporting ATPase subunit a